ncbi:hypothetical protein LPJ73_005611, partial [Coemansia sp. RSA 2703]
HTGMMASDGYSTDPNAQISVDTVSPEKIADAAIGQSESHKDIKSEHDVSTTTNGVSVSAAETAIATSPVDSGEPLPKRMRIEESSMADSENNQMSIVSDDSQLDHSTAQSSAAMDVVASETTTSEHINNGPVVEVVTPPKNPVSDIAMDISPEKKEQVIVIQSDTDTETKAGAPKASLSVATKDVVITAPISRVGQGSEQMAATKPAPPSMSSKPNLTIDVSAGSQAEIAQPASIMTKEQHKYCSAMVRALKKHRDAVPFLNPVDIVALNIPDYPTIVTHPMDLGTIDTKLRSREYVDTQGFIDDLRLMFNNCYMYNGRESVVGNMAANLETMFESQLKKMPSGIDTALAEHNRRTSEAGTRTPNTASVARPKRDSHPPPSRDLPNMQRKKSRTADPQLRFCLNVVKEFMKKANFSIAYPFLEPVDPVAMNCPDYFTVIKEPMDLSTIKSKLENDVYSGPLEFESDMRLMLRNCYTYNPPGHPVHEAGRALEARFDSKWTELPVVRSSQSPATYSGGAAIAHSPP